MGFRLEVELERLEPEGVWEVNCNSSCMRKNIRQGSYTARLASRVLVVVHTACATQHDTVSQFFHVCSHTSDLLYVLTLTLEAIITVPSVQRETDILYHGLSKDLLFCAFSCILFLSRLYYHSTVCKCPLCVSAHCV